MVLEIGTFTYLMLGMMINMMWKYQTYLQCMIFLVNKTVLLDRMYTYPMWHILFQEPYLAVEESSNEDKVCERVEIVMLMAVTDDIKSCVLLECSKLCQVMLLSKDSLVFHQGAAEVVISWTKIKEDDAGENKSHFWILIQNTSSEFKFRAYLFIHYVRGISCYVQNGINITINLTS